jgi:hypothetical protein
MEKHSQGVSVPEIALVHGNGICKIDDAARGCVLHMKSTASAPQAGAFMQIIFYQRVSGGSTLSVRLSAVVALRALLLLAGKMVSSTTRRRSLWNHHLSDRLMFLPPPLSSSMKQPLTDRGVNSIYVTRTLDLSRLGICHSILAPPAENQIKSNHDPTRCEFVTARGFVACMVGILRGRET